MIILMGADRFAKLKILGYYNDKHADTKQTFAYQVQNSVRVYPVYQNVWTSIVREFQYAVS